jgi:putative phage-type endonuclease
MNDMSWAKTIIKNERQPHEIQGSEEWLKWRRAGIGSSEAPVLMNDSPWKTIDELLLEKQGLGKPFEGNFATERGKALEPIARRIYEEIVGHKFKDEIAEHPEHKILRASYDGINHELKRVLEIKAPGIKDHQEAASGSVPQKYKAQLQWLLMVSGYEDLDYMSYHPDGHVILNIKADKEYQAKMIEKALEFWKLVQAGVKPPEPMKPTEALESLMRDYASLSKAIDDLETSREEVKEKLKLAVPDKCDMTGYRVQWIERKGSVDYSKVPQLIGVDLEPFRKESSKVFDIRKIKI